MITGRRVCGTATRPAIMNEMMSMAQTSRQPAFVGRRRPPVARRRSGVGGYSRRWASAATACSQSVSCDCSIYPSPAHRAGRGIRPRSDRAVGPAPGSGATCPCPAGCRAPPPLRLPTGPENSANDISRACGRKRLTAWRRRRASAAAVRRRGVIRLRILAEGALQSCPIAAQLRRRLRARLAAMLSSQGATAARRRTAPTHRGRG